MKDLVKYIRDFLADPDGDRWSDERILYLINQAQKDIARRTLILYTEADMEIQYDSDDGDAIGYMLPLPDDFIRLRKVLHNNCEIPIVTECNLKEYCSSSCGCSGEVQYVIADSYGRGSVDLKCRPNDNRERIYGDVEVPCPVITYDCCKLVDCYTLYQACAKMEKTTIKCDGVLKCCIDNQDVLTCYHEVKCYENAVIGIKPTVLKVIYNRMPKRATSIDDELDVGPLAEQAVKFYVCGMLLRDDKDSNSRALGNEELQMYTTEIKQLKKERERNFYDGTNYNLPYRRGI